jgi:hypothetical protein
MLQDAPPGAHAYGALHAVAQQMWPPKPSSTQSPLAHWLSVGLHCAPRASWPLQLGVVQNVPLTQLESFPVVHVV